MAQQGIEHVMLGLESGTCQNYREARQVLSRHIQRLRSCLHRPNRRSVQQPAARGLPCPRPILPIHTGLRHSLEPLGSAPLERLPRQPRAILWLIPALPCCLLIFGGVRKNCRATSIPAASLQEWHVQSCCSNKPNKNISRVHHQDAGS